MQNKFILPITILSGGLVGLLSSIFIINYDYIYSIQEIFNFSKKTIYLDFFPFVGIGSPIIFGFMASFLTNKIIFIFFLSFIFNSLFTHIFYKITYFVTNNKLYSFCAGITGAFWFASNFGLVFYQDYIAYYFFLLAVYFSFKRQDIFNILLTSLLLVTSFHFKNSIGLISVCVFFFVDFLTKQENFTLKTKIKTFIFFILFFILTLFVIYLLFDFRNYYEYTFKILLTEGTDRISTYNNFSANYVYLSYLYEIIYNVILPYKINLVEAVNEKSIGRLLFLPFVLIFYFLIFFSFYNLNKIIRRAYISNHIKIFYLIFISSFLISVVAGRNFTQLTFGIPIIAFTTLFFFVNKKNIIFVSLLTFIFLSSNLLYKYYHSGFFKDIYHEPITTKEISPIYFYNLKSQLDTSQLLDAYSFIKKNNLNNIIYLGHNAKIISFLTGEQGLEYDSYFHYDMVKDKDRFTYDCKLKGLIDCELFLINYVNNLNSEYILISDNFYYSFFSKFYLLVNKNYIKIYNASPIHIYKKK